MSVSALTETEDRCFGRGEHPLSGRKQVRQETEDLAILKLKDSKNRNGFSGMLALAGSQPDPCGDPHFHTFCSAESDAA